MPFRFTWTCRADSGSFDLFAPGVTQIEWEVYGGSVNALGKPVAQCGSVESETLLLKDNGHETWVRMHRGTEATKWVQLTAGYGTAFDTSAKLPKFELGV